MNDPDAWRTPMFRQRVIKSIEDAVANYGGGISPRPPADMETQAFQKAKSKEEYLNLVSKVIVYVRESANQKKAVLSAAGGMQGGMQPMPQQDPLNALTSMTKVGSGGAMMGAQQPPMGMAPVMQPMMPRPAYSGYPVPQHRPMQPMQHYQPMPMPVRQGGPQGPYPQPGMPYSANVHSPANMSQLSPATMPSPSQAAAVTPSPGPRPLQVPSPAQVTLNTPQSGPVPSPADGKTAEEIAYLDKLNKLQKFVEPLKRIINKIENDNDRQKDYNKMKNLLNILTDSSKRVPMETLTKCQNVLEKLDYDWKRTPSVGEVTLPTPGHGGQHMCQSLINHLAAHIKQPLFNHTLNRTFGPAVDALHGAPIRAPSPPSRRKRRHSESAAGTGAVSDLLQGEIARLHHKFTVDLDTFYHQQSKAVHLICKLEDKNLPSVPPISVTVPENYPATSPLCHTHSTGYEATPFLQRVHTCLTSQLEHMPATFSVSALLNIWEMSVRKASVGASPSA